jgi:hypothetical protein
MALHLVSREDIETTVILLLAPNSSPKQNVEIDSHGTETNHPILMFRKFSATTFLQKPQRVKVISLVYNLPFWKKIHFASPYECYKKAHKNEQVLHI